MKEVSGVDLVLAAQVVDQEPCVKIIHSIPCSLSMDPNFIEFHRPSIDLSCTHQINPNHANSDIRCHSQASTALALHSLGQVLTCSKPAFRGKKAAYRKIC